MTEPFVHHLRITERTREALRSLVGSTPYQVVSDTLRVRWPSVETTYLALGRGDDSGYVVFTSETRETPAERDYGRIHASEMRTLSGSTGGEEESGAWYQTLISLDGEPSTVSLWPGSGGRPITSISVFEEAIAAPPLPDYGSEDVRADSVLVFACGRADAFCIRVGHTMRPVVEFYGDWRLVSETTRTLREVESIPPREEWQ